MKNTLNLLIGFAIIAGFIYGIIRLLAWGYNQILSIDSTISAALITGILTITGTTLSITIPQYLKKKLEIEQHLRTKKSENYKELIELLFKILMGEKIGEPLKEKELIKSMSKFTENLILWGSEDVIKSYKSYRLHFSKRSQEEPLTLETINLIENLLLSIRKDMGHNNKNLNQGDILSLFINDLDDVIRKLKAS